MRTTIGQALVAAGLVLCFRALFGPVEEDEAARLERLRDAHEKARA